MVAAEVSQPRLKCRRIRLGKASMLPEQGDPCLERDADVQPPRIGSIGSTRLRVSIDRFYADAPQAGANERNGISWSCAKLLSGSGTCAICHTVPNAR